MAAGILEACFFGPCADDRWDRMARVLELTAARHCPTWRRRVSRLTVKIPELGTRNHARNTVKLNHWREVVQACDDGDRLLLIDADTFIVRPLDDVWENAFDLAYTTKRGHDFPFNGGVVFVRISPRVRRFFDAWYTENVRLLHVNDRMPWRQKYGGVNQASFANLLQTAHELEILELPCAEWNCEESAWASFDPAFTRIVHVKSALRMACVESQPIPEGLKALASLWKSLDREARSEQCA